MADTSLVIYKGSPLEQIATREVMEGVSLKKNRIFLATDVVIGKYGVIGFGLVDSKPEDRWKSYTDGVWIGVVYNEDSFYLLAQHKDSYADAKLRRSHYIGTSDGFKLARYFVLPRSVMDFFDRDEFLGEPLIEKCLRQGTLPADFDEEKADPYYAFHMEEPRELVDAILAKICPEAGDAGSQVAYKVGLAEALGISTKHYPYVSFHSWWQFRDIIQIAQDSLVASVANLDAVLAHYDTNHVLQLTPSAASHYKQLEQVTAEATRCS